jgi:heme/copper-type cytochrome/quinol oxidase subunit 4
MSDIIKKISFFTSVNVIFNMFAALSSILMAKILTPFTFGQWQTIRLMLQYTSYSDLGTRWALNRRLSASLSDNATSSDDIAKLRNSAYSFNVLAALIVAVVLCLVLSLQKYFTLYIVFTVGLLVVIQQLYSFYYFSFVSQKRHEYATVMTSIFNAGGIVLIIPLAYFFKLTGAILGQLSLFIFTTVYIYRY